MFIDATYEGDLMAAARVRFHASVQAVDYSQLRERLLTDGQCLE